ncbi:hypothetical protein SLNSH_21280 [Alsobacter soli]|uniref:DUF305 domain-containing protein n=1 Tax=Alsobacter soli TaxID=2109933 RepID=A0A2T1HMM9_9HYPH|nr:DUF305 domain-containing protein [Alsobacter soli]PSC02925.1 hypothetical protein SLNSH_21280 [Alsobacter soli]
MQDAMKGMDETHKGYMQAMVDMRQPMMEGMMAKDADVAFVCGMIPHHQGAIAMARVVLKHGDDPQARKIAERMIKDQEKDFQEMTAWRRSMRKSDTVGGRSAARHRVGL